MKWRREQPHCASVPIAVFAWVCAAVCLYLGLFKGEQVDRMNVLGGLVCLAAAIGWTIRAIREKRDRAKETDAEDIYK